MRIIWVLTVLFIGGGVHNAEFDNQIDCRLAGRYMTYHNPGKIQSWSCEDKKHTGCTSCYPCGTKEKPMTCCGPCERK